MQRGSKRPRRLGSITIAAALALALGGTASAAPQPDAWVTTKVKMALLTSEGVSGTAVSVDTIDGRVTLHGSVSTAGEKARAEKVSSQIDGVREVRNLLQVVPPKAEARTEATDDQIQEQVRAALKADPALADSSISVKSVNAGVVLLAGKAGTLTDAYRAMDDAAGVAGVSRVASEIESPDTLGDAELWRDGAYDAVAYETSAARDLWITTAAKMRLLANADTPAMAINVDTEDRIVTLFGMVGSAATKEAAEAEVRKVGGVRNVVNDLQIVAESKQDRVEQSDDQITKAIESRIGSYETLSGSEIDVGVSDGVARLTGTVLTRRDQLTALTVARSTAGVTRVIDDLRLETPAVSAR
jgi:osmotically-inducible protein OsmY